MCVKIYITYSPIKPKIKIWTDPRVNNPIIIGAIPKSKELQFKIFLKKKINATNMETILKTKPINVIILRGNFECLIIAKIPISYNV